MRIALATTNQGKIKEIQAILDLPGIEWLTVNEAGDWPVVEETGDGFAENARLKATAVARYFNLPALADDSGLEVDALGGLPGVRSSRFAGPDATDANNTAKLVAELRALSEAAGGGEKRFSARFVSVVVLSRPDGGTVEARGVCEGEITLAPRGAGGFGYDPVFVPAGFDRTMAELAPAEKNRLSHRGQALRALRRRLESEAGAGV